MPPPSSTCSLFLLELTVSRHSSSWAMWAASTISFAVAPGRAFWLIVRDGGRFNTGAGTTVPTDEPFGEIEAVETRNEAGAFRFEFARDTDLIDGGIGADAQLDAAGPQGQGEVGAIGHSGIELFREGRCATLRDGALHAEYEAESPSHQRLGKARDFFNLQPLGHGATMVRDGASFSHRACRVAGREHQ